MTTRAERTAATRLSIARAAAALLDENGPGAVAIRAVGDRAGVSRGAVYGHFGNRDGLLAQVRSDGWLEFATLLEAVNVADLSTRSRLTRFLSHMLDLAHDRPHLYQLMWGPPRAVSDPLLEGAHRSQKVFLQVVADAVGQRDARRWGALLMSSAHGIAEMEIGGHLRRGDWDVSGSQLVQSLVELIAGSAPGRNA